MDDFEDVPDTGAAGYSIRDTLTAISGKLDKTIATDIAQNKTLETFGEAIKSHTVDLTALKQEAA